MCVVSSAGVGPRVKIIQLDEVLSLPVLLRSYFICRAIMFLIHVYEDASPKTLLALNRIISNLF
ncbi:hypothetical protein MAR_017666 [Mya arenaria]|uniref:Uncharacterized protein n=1 Tax=Mya arenaria TaxID=6604 RepID=A0ABY7ECG9_MYAAR|nr:hypothetical protein MAR_017666 [Mya arenaria]